MHVYTVPSEVQGGAGGAGVEVGSGVSRPEIGGELDTGVVDGCDTCVVPISCRFAYVTGRYTHQAAIGMPSTAKAMRFQLVTLQPHFGTPSHAGEEVPSTFVFWSQQV